MMLNHDLVELEIELRESINQFFVWIYWVLSVLKFVPKSEGSANFICTNTELRHATTFDKISNSITGGFVKCD